MLKLIFLFLFSPIGAQAKLENYVGTATNKSKSVIYIEKHLATYSDQGNIIDAKTEYLRPNGEPIGHMSSNFKESIHAPEYTFNDLRDQSAHGVRYEKDTVIMWRQDKGKSKEEKVYARDKIPKEVLLVGCQGLHYYLVQNFHDLKMKKQIKLKYLIPGKLEDYDFTLNFVSEDLDHIYLSVSINNLFLKMFVSSLELKYRKTDRRLIHYSGLSNIPGDKGEIQNISLTYKYEQGML